MNNCRYCGHPRMLHDTWGCKSKCGCEVSIVYLTSLNLESPANLLDQSVDEELIQEGIRLGAEEDRLEESHLRVIHQRSVAEVTPQPDN